VEVALLLGVGGRVLAGEDTHEPDVVRTIAQNLESFHEPGEPVALDAHFFLDLRGGLRGAGIIDGRRLARGGFRRRGFRRRAFRRRVFRRNGFGRGFLGRGGLAWCAYRWCAFCGRRLGSALRGALVGRTRFRADHRLSGRRSLDARLSGRRRRCDLDGHRSFG
jgi:hypothetical protein